MKDKKLNELLDKKDYESIDEYLKNNSIDIFDIIEICKHYLYSFQGQRAKTLFFKYKDNIQKVDYYTFSTLYLSIYIVLNDDIGLQKAKNEILSGPYVDIAIEEFRNHLDEAILILKNTYSKQDEVEEEIDINKTKKLIASDTYEMVITGLHQAEELKKQGIDLTSYISQITRKYTKYSLKFYYLIVYLISNGVNESFTIDKFDIPITFSLKDIRPKFSLISNQITEKLNRTRSIAKDVGAYQLFYVAFCLVEAYLIPERLDNLDLNTLFRVTYDIVMSNFEKLDDDPLISEFPYIDSLYDEYSSFVKDALQDAFFETTTNTSFSINQKASA